MATHSKRPDFFTSEDGFDLLKKLEAMIADKSYNTSPSYSANSELYPDNLMPFIDKHVAYLQQHPSIDPWQYIANLRLMTRLR